MRGTEVIQDRKTTQGSVNTTWQETPLSIALCFMLKDTNSSWKTRGEHNIAERTMALESDRLGLESYYLLANPGQNHNKSESLS